MDYKKILTFKWTAILAVFAVTLFSACSDDSSVIAPQELQSETFTYEFNEGQLLGDVSTAYRGEHGRNLRAEIMVEEMESGNASVTVSLFNTIDGENYPVHAHDAADPNSTPNGTPYNETPNGNIFAQAIMGNGGEVSATNESTLTYDELVNQYEGFFVVHDPTQDITTTDLTTYLVLGSFGQSLGAGEQQTRMQSFEYSFNEGQLLDDPNTAYEGQHSRDLSATMMVEELLNGNARITVTLENTVDGESYPVHSHDAADPNSTPNGTPYNETPNSDILANVVSGNGGSASVTVETEETEYLQLINEYDGFFVVHDPLQAISTTDVTTYLVLGKTAR